MAGKYETHVKPYLDVICAWAADGVIEEEIAKNLRVAYSTLRQYKKKNKELAEVLQNSKEIADRRVENALYKRALGYRYEEITKERRIDQETGEIEMAVTKRVTKEVMPDTSAAAIWLKNRRPVNWKDKQEVEYKGDIAIDLPEALKEWSK